MSDGYRCSFRKELDVIDMGKTDEGFAADYEGVYSVTKIKKITNY